jgi:hypothetical protein
LYIGTAKPRQSVGARFVRRPLIAITQRSYDDEPIESAVRASFSMGAAHQKKLLR